MIRRRPVEIVCRFVRGDIPNIVPVENRHIDMSMT